MGRPGPKPVDQHRLESEATSWACFFFTLRDGQSGHMEHVKWLRPEWRTMQRDVPYSKWKASPAGSTKPPKGILGWKWVPRRKIKVHIKGTHRWKWETVGEIKVPVRSSQRLEPGIIIPVQEAARVLPPKTKTGEWFIFRPTMPKPEVWEKLKKARSVEQVRHAVRAIGGLREAFTSSLEQWAQKPDKALSQYAREILVAKCLPHYPRTGRERSEDKRIVFLAKVMAGATVGLAPITAVKRLSHWSWPKDWAEKRIREMARRSKGNEPLQTR
jgi:hypothetical protein